MRTAVLGVLCAAVAIPVALAACGDGGGGTCLRLDCQIPAPDAAPACARDTDCALGSICAGARCRPGCRSTRDCPAGDTCDPQQGTYGTCLASGRPDAGTPPPAIDASVADVPVGPLPDANPPPPTDANIPVPDGCALMNIEVVSNGSFDVTPNNAWSATGQAGIGVISGFPAHSLPNLGWIGGVANHADSLAQSVSIPGDVVALTLSGWVWVSTTESSLQPAKDILDMRLEAPILGSLISFGHFSNADASGGWHHFSDTEVNVLLGLGLGTTLRFELENDLFFPTTVYLDDVSLIATVCR